MTDAMTRHEIEDVLSSIRRLVSHDDRAAQAQAQPAGRAGGKLVLTSALRVDDDRTASDTRAGDGIAQVGITSTDSGGAETAQQDQETPQAPAPAAATPTDTDRVHETPRSASLVARIAQAGAQSSSVTAADGHATDMDDPVAVEVNDTALETTLARLEQALSITGAAPDLPTDPDAAAKQEADTTVIDEAALAEVVSRIVRQELQGELGERITRNIRKLVRAEVARELQMRNL
ncbi:MAG: hypothetical protein GVY34_13025 [Alphaproteobacteria bacterium]|jgi:hypothetical protein|nr:hypothetical protein [Alphaproteobacteria bacterium]